MKIAIIDYNAGNIASVANALERFGYEYTISKDPKIILSADKVIFPGQGRAKPAMEDLKASGLNEIIKQIKAPFLGICLGMQLLLPFSEEDDTECLGILPGRVKKFSASSGKVPQIGWNTITQAKYDPLFENIPDTLYAYFVNSFYVDTDAKYTLAASQYGTTKFASVIKKDNFYGTQFHPEKSGSIGVQMLKNFCELGLPKQHSTFVIPAIDLVGGKCVRLYQGNYQKQITYSISPVEQAKNFVKEGSNYLHVIDLEGAKNGQPMNAETIFKIAKSIGVPVGVGGGIRTLADAKGYLDAGVARVIMSTAALTNPGLIQGLIAEYGPGRVVISIDAKGGMVAIKGWQETTNETVDSLLKKLAGLEVTTIIYTDISSDGALSGPNFPAIEKILAQPFNVIIAGGVTTFADAEKIASLGAYGVIVGKALYEGKFNLREALGKFPSAATPGPFVKPARTTTKRVIACMDIAGGRVVKGTNFQNLRDAGDPVELGKLYSDSGVDELVFLDINATVENRSTLYELVSRIAKNINIPFTVGGGVKNIEDIKQLLMAGADKVSIGSAAATTPYFINQASRAFGAQCIVISVDPKWNGQFWEIYIKGGREATGINAVNFTKDMQARGAGELLVNSLDRDGTKEGYDIALLKAIAKAVSLPIVASSGAGKMQDFADAFTKGAADAALAASLFHYQTISIPDLKQYLAAQNILIRQ